MEIAYIIGNGFDLNLGLETRYKNFYEYYNKIESASESIKRLKQAIARDITQWVDLELALGAFTSDLQTVEQFDEVYEDLVDKLGEYLITQEGKFDLNKINHQKFFDDLGFPEANLPALDIQELRNYKRPWETKDWKINIITLNYTRILEAIFDNKFKGIPIGIHNEKKIVLSDLQHIHGFTDNRTILGVNDLTQLANKGFHDNEDILETMVKPLSNRAQRHSVDTLCERYLLRANLICIFGSSIGETDNYWWQLIGEQLKRDIRIIIFYEGDIINERFGHIRSKLRRRVKKMFLDKTNLSEEEKVKYESNIYIGINTQMFDILING